MIQALSTLNQGTTTQFLLPQNVKGTMITNRWLLRHETLSLKLESNTTKSV